MVINTRKKDIIWNYLGIFFNLGSNVLFFPVMIYCVSPDMIGIWYIFVSIGAIVQLFDMGFNPTISHCISYAWSGATDLKKNGVIFTEDVKEPNFPLLCGVLKACRYLYLRIALLAAFVMMGFGTFYIYHVAYPYLSVELYIAWFVYILAIFTNLYIGYYTVVLNGIGDVFRKNRANIIAKGVFISVSVIGLVAGYGILCLSISFLLSGFILRYLCKKYLIINHDFVYLLDDNGCENGKYTGKYVIETMWHNAWRDGLVTITAYLTGQATILLSGLYLSLYETGIYSVSMQIINVLLGVAAGLFYAYIPALQSCYITQKIEDAKVLYQRGISCFYFLTFIGVICFLWIGIPIIQLIRPDFVIDRLDFTLLAISTFYIYRHRLAACLISTWNTLPYTFAFIVFGVLSVISTYIGLAYFQFGIIGLICIPLFVESLYNNWKWVMVVNCFYRITEISLLKFGVDEAVRLFRCKFHKN